ncbi:hypothetical protein MPSEU_000483600 [Mayamaea pseudoterrestris]|nr:hypothetical protein MPSEU_000483600 [Mayamaea pseudoterrestris]
MKIIMTMALSASIFLLLLASCYCSGIRSFGDTHFEVKYDSPFQRELQVSEAPATAPLLPSFDGRLDVILGLAVDKAAFTIRAASPSPVQAPLPFMPSKTPSMAAGSTNLQSCDGIDSTAAEYTSIVISFTYSLETVRHADIYEIGRMSEEVLEKLLAPFVLGCLNGDVTSAGIVMINSLPEDTISSSMTCKPEVNATNICTVWDAKMNLLITDKNKTNKATNLTLAALRVSIDERLVDDVHRLVRATFITNPNHIPATSAEKSPGGEQLDSNFGLSSVLVVSFASAAMVIVAGAVYLWKRSTMDVSFIDATTTNGWNSTIMNDSNVADRTRSWKSTGMDDSNILLCPPDESEKSVSPLSQMIPDAYGFNTDMSLASGSPSGMPVIAEELEHSFLDDNSSAIIMSEADFSTDNDSSLLSFDVAKSNYIKYPETESPLNLLGARARNSTLVMSNFGDESDSDLSSDLEGNYRSTTPIPFKSALDGTPRDGLLTLDNTVETNNSDDDDNAFFK